jgi:hypothetical protein
MASMSGRRSRPERDTQAHEKTYRWKAGIEPVQTPTATSGGSLLLITNIGMSATKAFHTNFEMHSNSWWISSTKSIEC